MKACPVCGRICEYCHHYEMNEGERVYAKEMTSSEIRQLLTATIEDLKSEISRLECDLREVAI